MHIILVESKNDKIFLNALVSHLNLSNTEVDDPILLDENNYILMDGSDSSPDNPGLLIRKLKDLKTDIRKKGIINIGIVLDLDDNSLDDRLLTVNNAIKEAFKGDYSSFTEITETSTLYPLDYTPDLVYFACYFTNVEESGELETLLRNIATQNSDHADCLASWKDCIEHKGHSISTKDFDKFWISNYLRFDTCSTKERNQAGKYCSLASFDYIMKNKSHIFNLDSPLLEELSNFLRLFN